MRCTPYYNSKPSKRLSECVCGGGEGLGAGGYGSGTGGWLALSIAELPICPDVKSSRITSSGVLVENTLSVLIINILI